MVTLRCTWLFAIFCNYYQTSFGYEGFDPSGGVTEQKKLKTEDKYKIEHCKYRTQEHDIITWHYKGMLLNGKVFDEGNYKAQLGHRAIIYGVDQGMRGLCVGEKRRMTMHPDWAYGKRGTGNIPGDSVLIFDVHLLKVERPGDGIETLVEKFEGNGGVSEEKKLVIKELYKKDPEECRMSSGQDDVIYWHYKGKLLDGHVFDEGKFHAKLGHGQVITGVDKAMRGLCVGEKRRMTIHPDWGYGARGVPGTIPGHSVLIFDVELLKIEKPDGKRDVFDPTAEKKRIEKHGQIVLPDYEKLKIEVTYTINASECTRRSRNGDKIKWHYKGTFLDGTEFHSGHYEATLGQNEVIPGVDRGMKQMCVGEKRRLTIHPDWAYGEQGRPGSIPPNSTLVFDVELNEIHRPETGDKEEL